MYTDAFGVWNTVSRNDPLARCELSLKMRPARLPDPDLLPRNVEEKTKKANIDAVFLVMVWEEPQIFQIFAQSFPNIQMCHQSQGEGPLVCGSPPCHRHEENIHSTWSPGAGR